MDRFLALLLGLRYETNYNIGAHVYEINCSLAFLWCHCFLLHFRFRYNPWVWILGVPYFLILSIISETKISTLSNSAQVQKQSSQPILNHSIKKPEEIVALYVNSYDSLFYILSSSSLSFFFVIA